MSSRRFLSALGVVAFLVTAGPGLGAAPAPAPVSPLTNTVITCLQGTTWHPTNAIFRGSVRVFDPQLYLECEHLTVYYPSNSAPNPGSPASPPPGRNEATPSIGNITTIVAETNLLMMMRGATIIGDRAVYWATNDMIQVTGEIVVIETENGYAYGSNFTFNRRTMELSSDGPSTLESKPGVSLLEGTNAPAGPPGSPRPARGNPAPVPPNR